MALLRPDVGAATATGKTRPCFNEFKKDLCCIRVETQIFLTYARVHLVLKYEWVRTHDVHWKYTYNIYGQLGAR